MIQHPDDLVEALEALRTAFDAEGVKFYVGGSVASTGYGLPRTTLDADLVVTMSLQQLERVANRLIDAFHIDVPSAAASMRTGGSFNFVYLPKMVKIDIFPCASMLQASALRRALPKRLEGQTRSTAVPVCTAEDIVLHKLEWFQMSGSERQWIDILNVLKVQATVIDNDYLNRWADDLELAELLRRAREHARL